MTTEIKDRITQIQNGEVPHHYKKTKVGIVPDEWEVKKMGEISKRTGQKNATENLIPYSISNINGFVPQEEIFDAGGYLNVDKSAYKKVYRGEFAYNPARINVGSIGLLKDMDAVIVSSLYVCFKFDSSIYNDYFEQYFTSYRFNFDVNNYTEGSVREYLFYDNFSQISCAIPTLHEQQKIAEILSAQDKVIELKEKLIAEKEQQKKYLMQNLLTGKKRLKGFSGEWKKVKLGRLFSERTERNSIYLSLLAITGTKGVIPRSELDTKDNSSEDKSKYLKICVGDIGYNTMRMWQGVSAYSEYEGIVSPAYTILNPQSGTNAKYFSYLFKMPNIIFMFYRFSQGLVDDTRNLKYSNFKQIKVTYPCDISEQNAIAEILSTADREIELLKADLAEEKQKKKALMQLLLTGIVRV